MCVIDQYNSKLPLMNSIVCVLNCGFGLLFEKKKIIPCVIKMLELNLGKVLKPRKKLDRPHKADRKNKL